MEPEKHSKSARNPEVGKQLNDNEGSSLDHDEVIVWCGNKDMSGEGCSGSQDNLIDMPFSTVRINDLAPSRFGLVNELQILRESNISSSNKHPQRVFKKIQRNKDKASDKNERTGSGSKGIVGGFLEKEMRQTGIQHGVSKLLWEQRKIENSGAHKAKSGKKHKNKKFKVKEPLHGNVEVSGRKMEDQRDEKEIWVPKQENTNFIYGPHGVYFSSNLGTEESKGSGTSLSSNLSTEECKGSGHCKKVVDVPGKSEVMSQEWVEIETLTATEKEVSCQGKVNKGHTVINGIVDHKMLAKISPETLPNVSNVVHTCPKSEGLPLKGILPLERITDNPNHGRETFENAKEAGGKGYVKHGIHGSGTDGEGQVYSKHAKNQDGVSEELGEVAISESHISMKVQDSLPPKYVPLMKLQNSKESETRKDCGTKSSISKQHADTVFNKTQRNKESTSDINEQRWAGAIRIEDGSLGKTEMRQAWSSGIEDRAPDKNKQIQSGNLGVSKGQAGKNGQKYEMARSNGKANAKGPLHGTVKMGGGKLEHHGVGKELEASMQRNKDKQKGPLLKGSSSFKGTTGRPNQGTECFENAKGTGYYVRCSFLGSGADAEGEVILKHVENKGVVSEEIEGGGICVSYPFPLENGRPQSIKKGGRQTDAIIITNNGNNSVKLFAVKLCQLRPNNSFSLSHTAGPVQSIQSENKSCLSSMDSLEVKMKSMKISQMDTDSISLVRGPWLMEPRHHLIIHLLCMANDIGIHRSSILFEFQDQKIKRNVTLLAEDEVSEQLAPQEPYSKSRKKKTSRFGRIVGGVPPHLPSFGKKLGVYPIPLHLKKIDGKSLPRGLKEGLSMKTYSQYFSTLLHLEELQMQEDMMAYDMHNVTMSSSGDFLVLKVPGLAEKRPSLIYRDTIYVTESGKKDISYEGYIHKIQANEIYVKFDKSFHKSFIPQLLYDVRFSFSRVSFRRCHQAVAAAGRMDENFLFPWDPSARVTHDNVSKIDPFNRHLNTEQLSAVHQIRNCYGLPPYLVYGPPGTGKTATLVEAMLQILKSNSNVCILACAPSNVASDLLVERLLGPIQKGEIFRLNAISRPYQDVPLRILPCCSYRDSMFCCPSVEELLKYRIIVSTYLSAAILDAQGVPQGHFTHIFLDESGQGTEPETMVPIANLANAETTVVLAGDPQQLGPIVLSHIGEKFGLGKSYFERLSELLLYSPDGGNKRFVTKLVRNYRSHPAILELPSRLFYGSELIACAGNGIQKLHCAWDGLLNKKFPVIFVGIEGIDEREGRSPSWFNTIEISKVLDIIKKLKADKRNSLTGKDIGVITPYRQQVVKLRKVFAANCLSDVKVGSVEQFQGDEKRVIIISTVRSNYKNEDFDMKFNLGFIGNPKRFNVAVTRAKSLLVAVGNPYILSKDRCWNELLQYCVSHKSYIGCLLPPKNNGDEFILMDEFPSGECSADSGTSGPMPIPFINEDMEWADGTR